MWQPLVWVLCCGNVLTDQLLADEAFGYVIMKEPPVLPEVPCWEAVQILPLSEQDKPNACDQARLVLVGMSKGLPDGITFGLRSEVEAWSQLDAWLAWWEGFKQNPGEYLAELRAQLTSIWNKRHEIVDAFLEAFRDVVLEKSGFQPGDSRLVPWGFGYGLGFVAGMLAPSTVTEAVTGLILSGVGLLAKLVVNKLAMPVLKAVKGLTRRSGRGLLSWVRYAVRDETGSLNLERFLRASPNTLKERLARAIDDLVARGLLSAEAQETLLRSAARLVEEAARNPNHELTQFTTLQRLEDAVRAATSKPGRPGRGPLAGVLDEALQEFGLSEPEFHLLRILPIEDLTPAQRDVLWAIRQRIPVPKDATVVKVLRLEWLKSLMGDGPNGQVGGHVALADHLQGAVTAEDYKDLLALRTVDSWGYDSEEYVGVLRTPLQHVGGVDILEIPARGTLDYPSTRNGFTAYTGPRVVPEYEIPRTSVTRGMVVDVIDRNGVIHASLRFDGDQWILLAGRVP